MASRSQPKRAVKLGLDVQSTTADKRKKQASAPAPAPAPALRVFPNAEEPSSISLPFSDLTIVISLPDVSNASAEDIQQFKGLIPQLERAFTLAALWPAPQFEEITLRTEILHFTFSCVPLTLSVLDHENASFEDIEEYSKVVIHIMSFFQQEASKPQKRGRGRPRASSVVTRRRALSVDSVASDQSTESQAREAIRGTIKQPIYKEREALKQIPPQLLGDINKYPSYLLQNVTVEVPPGLSSPEADYARNILHQLPDNPASRLKVTGMLDVEEAQKAQLVKYLKGEHANLNKQYITLDNVIDFSIGLDADTLAPALWVLSETGYFEIRPHPEYRFVYSNMCKAIGLQFFIEEWYQGSKAAQNWNSTDDEILAILREYTAFNSGATDTQHEWVLRCREYKKFFLHQIDKAQGAAVLKKSSIYEWFKQGCPDLQPSVAIQPYGPEPDAPHFYPVADASEDENDDEEDELEFDGGRILKPFDEALFAKHSVKEVVYEIDAPFHGPYISEHYPQGAPENASIPVHLAALICHIIDSGRCPDPKDLSIRSIATAIYKDFSIHERGACQKLLCYFGQEVVAELPVSYDEFGFYQKLAAFSKDLTVHDEVLKNNTSFENVTNIFMDIIEGRKPLIRRNEKNSEHKARVEFAKANNMVPPPRPQKNRRKAPADFETTSFSHQQAPGFFGQVAESKNGQASTLAPLKSYHDRYSAPKWYPEIEHCVNPTMKQRWIASMTREQRSKYYQDEITRLCDEKEAQNALKTPEELAQEERVARIKKSRRSYRVGNVRFD